MSGRAVTAIQIAVVRTHAILQVGGVWLWVGTCGFWH